ncbi:beta-N-acetylglucosaminidase domain-containing protein [Paenibacillus sp. JTLBN-2024]
MTKNASNVSKPLYELYPVPQSVVSSGGEAVLTKEVHIAVLSGLKEATLPKLQKALSDQGFTYSVSDGLKDGQTQIVLAEKSQAGRLSGTEYASDVLPERKEAYALCIGEKEGCGQIAVVGSDADGIHYGVVTLLQMLEQSDNRRLKTCRIVDYPEILYRGYIEGFYGYPWSHEDRMDLMEFGGRQKLNSYIYAPKDDPYHRKHWRDLYPEEKAKEIAELAAAGHANNLNFVWTIHPGDSIDLSSEEDFRSAIAKLEQLYALGVRQFGVLFDDLVGAADGKQQAEFINRIDGEFVKPKGDVRPLLTVGTRYCEAWGPSMTEYFKPLVETLHDDVEIMWTGAATMSNISKEQYDAPKRRIGSDRNLSVWWNYPVNDYCDSKILMGKIENLSPDLDNVNGFFANPMNQAQASKQALFCIADHNWNTDAFDPERSFSASFKAIAPEVAEDLEIFASNSCHLKDDGGASGDFYFDESWDAKKDIADLREGFKSGRDISGPASALLARFERMEQAADRIWEKCLNRNLVEELDPFLRAFKLMAQAGQHAIHAANAMRRGDLIGMEQHNEDGLQTAGCHGRMQSEPIEGGKTVRLRRGCGNPCHQAVYFGHDRANGGPGGNGAACSGAWVRPEKHRFIVIGRYGQRIQQRERKRKCVENDRRHHLKRQMVFDRGPAAFDDRPERAEDDQAVSHHQLRTSGGQESKYWNTKHARILVSLDGESFTLIDEMTDNRADEINRILPQDVQARYVRLQIIEPTQMSIEGSGHTRIYGFELFDECYPEMSEKVPTSDIRLEASGNVVIERVKKGDVIALFASLQAEAPIAVSKPAEADGERIVFEGIPLPQYGNRIYVERTSGLLLPSVRTSKGLA